MAKQTFSVGQVLSAAQMTSLQATAMGGGTPQTKTASYVLVAADAGTVIQMNAAGATTITVNTSLFSAGDTVQIQNIGAGTCTVTAGTATVNTAGSLALTQYEGGILYFNSASAAVFFDFTQAGLTSPLTTKGDLYTRTSSADSRLAVGTDGYTLVADSAQSTGLKWAAPASGGGMTSIASGTFTATATLDLTSISSSYKNLQFVARNIAPVNDTQLIGRFNGLSTSIYNAITVTNVNGTAATAAYTAAGGFTLTAATGQSPQVGPLIINIYDYANTTSFKNVMIQYNHLNNGGQQCQMFLVGAIRTNDAIDRLTLSLGAGNFNASGTYTLYGVN